MTGTINTIGYALATLGPALGIGLVVVIEIGRASCRERV